MNQTEFAAIRRLVGLTAEQFGDKLSINPRTVRRWESGATNISDSAAALIQDLRAAHDLDFKSCLAIVGRGDTVTFPEGDGDRPNSWWLAVAARIIDREPKAQLKWS